MSERVKEVQFRIRKEDQKFQLYFCDNSEGAWELWEEGTLEQVRAYLVDTLKNLEHFEWK
jgi:hypothetical protein